MAVVKFYLIPKPNNSLNTLHDSLAQETASDQVP